MGGLSLAWTPEPKGSERVSCALPAMPWAQEGPHEANIGQHDPKGLKVRRCPAVSDGPFRSRGVHIDLLS